ncbi:MAG TPA: ABC transporter substrate-binding protein [Mycobacteriales bacterium]|jgi:peptide/nickel transport system substrate-binding protein|nr:ABC transporter substrate-binding protein [Mycobacteriales bacterium]
MKTSARRRWFYALLVTTIVSALTAACSGGGSSSAGGSAANGTPLVMASASPWTSLQYNPWTTNFPGAAGGFVYLPLAIQNWPSLTSFTPQLAKSWSATGNKLTITLQPKANWQDGKPVTSADLIDTIYLDGLTGSGVWNDISGISSSSPKEIVLTARSGVSMVLLENDLFNGVIPYPTSVWGKFATASLKKDIVTYYNASQQDPGAALKTPAYKNVAAALQKLLKFAPKTLMGDGPYKLAGITSEEAKLVKWSGFYDATHITIPQITFLGSQQPQVNAALLTGRADFSSGWLYMPPAIMGQWQHTQNANLLSVPGTFQGQIVFNSHQYPYSMTKVRQALAYAFPLKKMDELSWGTSKAHAIAPSIPDGLVDQVQAQFLDKSDSSALNPYSYDTGKAAALLQDAGFTKKNGQWFMPNGKQFTISLEMDAGWTDQISAFKVASSALTSFGIKTSFGTVEDASYQADLHNGNFQVAAFCCTGGSPNPILDFEQSPMGSQNNFTSTGANQGQRGLGFGPVETVPGIGKVNVPEELDRELHSVPPGAKMKANTLSWAKFVNDQVPYLEYADFANQIAFSTKNFSWPSIDDPMWSQLSSGNNLIVVGQEKGVIHPK